ncbi:amino acid ABC transporter membrane protein 1, PAAT family [Georgenia satyanarayanai]|uniref:Amino acid ABC transporter membrane protein 1, PAAT family n=1 Tax=Georgenia satyanarayanai TaxID=860221 RepID=A0A2Y9A3K6_9MICO|nr:ectoine/hydroxyectoine ABC transporter permease subunit EhuC [Georgenia satyanarayanai]PYG02252.1 amino acid ABC transporter membrane protein 1 (PAAT family) [Georgenia satyanarayanai]SSA37099.1 amino acid ABC transporter membrane protein 1, PAAT family [Georgenia satyanarayanai]
MSDNLDALATVLPRLLDGILVTLQLTVGGSVLAFLLAAILGITARHHNVVARGAARVFVEFFRGTSLLVQLFWLFYVLPLFGIELSSLFTGILALGLNYGAYGAEVVRGALNSVPKGQWEASVALSLSPRRRLFRIVWPQAWAIMIPSLSNLGIMLLKGSAVAVVIVLHDITFVTNQLRQMTNDTFFSYGVGMVVYFLIAYVLVLVANLAEARAKSRLGIGPPLRNIFRPRAAKAGVVNS